MASSGFFEYDSNDVESGKQSFIKAYGIYSSEESQKSESTPSSIYATRKAFLTPQEPQLSSDSEFSYDDYQLHHKRNFLMRKFSSSLFIEENVMNSVNYEMLKEYGFDAGVFDEEKDFTENLASLCGALLNICYTLNDAVQFIKKGDLKRAKFTQKSKTYEYAESDWKKYKERLSGKFGICFRDIEIGRLSGIE